MGTAMKKLQRFLIKKTNRDFRFCPMSRPATYLTECFSTNRKNWRRSHDINYKQSIS